MAGKVLNIKAYFPIKLHSGLTRKDKIVQRAVTDILNLIYEQDFHSFSYGFRPKRSDKLIEREHGKIGTDSRNDYKEKAQMFIVSEMLKQARKDAKLTQEQLAQKAG